MPDFPPVYVRVDVRAGHSTLCQPEDTTRLHVEVVGEGDPSEALRHWGELADGFAWIEVDAIKAAAVGRVADEWREALGAMVERAAANGAASSDRGRLRVDVLWSAEPRRRRRLF